MPNDKPKQQREARAEEVAGTVLIGLTATAAPFVLLFTPPGGLELVLAAAGLIVIKGLLVKAFLRLTRGPREELPWASQKRLSPALVGYVEVAFFTVAVAVSLSGVAIAMIAWLALKIGANWQSPQAKGYATRTAPGPEAEGDAMKTAPEPMADDDGLVFLRFTAIVAGLVSMEAALIAGLMLRPLFAGFGFGSF